MFKQHLEMIGRNETPSKKAKFWQSYVRSLKGSDDIRAHDAPRLRPTWRPLSSELPPIFRSIYDEPSTPAERITGVGYRYLPVHRETYGYSPRPIYSHHYNRPIGEYEFPSWDAERAWADHQRRMKEIERRYPSRYGLYLKDKPNTVVVPLEYEPEDKPIKFGSEAPPYPYRAMSVPPFTPSSARALSVPPRDARAASLAPTAPLSALDLLRLPIYRGGWPRYNSVDNLLNPRASLPRSSIVRDPFWYGLGDLRPFDNYPSYYHLPALLRESYLSPIKRRYLWSKHPIRPFAHTR